MNITNSQYFLLFVSALAFVGFLTPLIRRFAISKEILDLPNSSHKSHSKPIPYLGGVAMILGVIIVTYFAILFSNISISNFWLATSIIAPAALMGIVGLWDDIRSLHPFPRFIAQTISGIAVAVVLILTNNFGAPTGSILVDVFITVLWIVGICNSINFFDNIDGGAAGTIAISALALTYIAISNGQALIGALSIVVAGASLGFLIWNRSPARIYMGDAGALFLGVLIATLTIRLKPNTDSIITSFAIPIFLLGAPILDTSVAVISRLRRKISPFKGGQDHLSHRLIRSGISRKNSVIFLWLISAAFCSLAILAANLNLGLERFVVVLGSLLWIGLFFGFFKKFDS
jgi:UDP-GlcNAc:undecaprenyl-phosphate GlcNAc-1-phosphate transferase